ncbi:hypothetical protein BDU57DRAFT_537707 [Ampelomyces quisqualis]|uniref:Uncharacterized protein n=1 Tax=Ampelomyces quisqualis TaxID=50730 RepID=A0A6A5QR31_AMPQU|nr:hypothetical protein BDU57DRAFT_537707 [Ampelomyces quisqualis]
MKSQHTSEKRTAPEDSSGINSLIAAANKDDRFRLLEDNTIPAGNLPNTIHPVLGWFDCDGPMKQMLRLASQFLTHDSTLVFFIPLLYGRELKKTNGKTTKTYLSDPLPNSPNETREQLITGVRQALHCLAHSIEFRFMKPEKRVYARTLTNPVRPVHTSTCTSVFQRRLTAVIEIADRLMHFYQSDDGYKASSRCAQFRHDFIFASTLVHEIVHAVGVMRRGNLVEPCIRINDPDPEWGYAWEHFIFGCVINPQDRTQPGTNLFMRKVWADPSVAEDAGGKEYSDVPMSYIAQWFRQETWDIVARKGPTAIAAPVTHFKIQSSRKYGAWIVSTDCIDIKPDIVALHQKWKLQSQKFDANGHPRAPASKILWRFQTSEALQRPNVPTPVRIPWEPDVVQTCAQKHGRSDISHVTISRTIREKRGDICQGVPSIPICNFRKRRLAEEVDPSYPTSTCKKAKNGSRTCLATSQT